MEIEYSAIGKIASKNTVSRLEVNSLLDSFVIKKDFIIVVLAVEIVRPKIINVRYDILEEIMKATGHSYLLFENEEMPRPDANSRRIIISRFHKLRNSINHVAYSYGKDMIIEDGIKFIMSGAEISDYSVHHNREEAIAKLDAIRALKQ